MKVLHGITGIVHGCQMFTGKEKRVLNLKYLKGKYISDYEQYKCLAMLNGVLCNEKKIKKFVEKKNRRPTSLK